MPARPPSEATATPGGSPSWRPFLTPERLAETGSTNADLLERARAGAPEGTVILAERQTAGRGRLGRLWLDHPSGSVLCSMLFRPQLAREKWHLAGWVVALAAADAVREAAGVDCACKWPNDLVAGAEERKVAGVLGEVAPGDPGALVVGIGINCRWPAEFPPPGLSDAALIAVSAISLDRLAGRPVEPDAVALPMLGGVARRWDELRHDAGAEAALRSEYRNRCATLGRLVLVQLPDEELVGRALDVDDSGCLLLDVGTCLRTVAAGDVVHVRPGGA